MALWKRLVEKARGILGLGSIGGLAGVFGGLLWTAADALWGFGPFSISETVGFMLGGAFWGSAGGIGFAALLATAEAKRSLDELPLWRMSLLGALVGAAVPALYMLATSGTLHFVDAPEIVATVVGSGAIFGALLAPATVALGKRALSEELAVVQETAALLEAE